MANATLSQYRLLSDGKYASSAGADGLPRPLLVAAADFTDGNLVPQSIYNGYTWSNGSQSGSTTTIVSNSYKVTYPSPTGDQYNWLQLNVPDGVEDLYFEFRSKMPAATNGLKNLKIFGKNITGGLNEVANTTLVLQYTAVPDGLGSLTQISFGDGHTKSNDTDQVVNLDGSYPAQIGRSYGNGAVVSTPQGKNWKASDWGTGWHTFRFHAKFNSGTTALNEVNDGKYFLSIDGNTYADASGLFNRHYSNGTIDHIQWGGYSQGGGPAFEIWYDDIKVSRYGFMP